MSTIYLDVTDYVEFLTRSESPSGVQRVVAEVSPLLMASHAARPVLLDRARGVFVELTGEESDRLLRKRPPTSGTGLSEDAPAQAAAVLERARAAQPVTIDSRCTLVFLGALWINDALMGAARLAHTQGATLLHIFYNFHLVFSH